MCNRFRTFLPRLLVFLSTAKIKQSQEYSSSASNGSQCAAEFPYRHHVHHGTSICIKETNPLNDEVVYDEYSRLSRRSLRPSSEQLVLFSVLAELYSPSHITVREINSFCGFSFIIGNSSLKTRCKSCDVFCHVFSARYKNGVRVYLPLVMHL